MFFSFFGFMVRGTSEGVFDTLEFILGVCGLAAVLSARLFLNVAWYDSLIAAIPFAVLLPYLRALIPRTDLPDSDAPSGAEVNVSARPRFGVASSPSNFAASVSSDVPAGVLAYDICRPHGS